MPQTHGHAAPIVVEQTYEAPIERVWRAITEPTQMRQWFFETLEDFRAEQGFETKFIVRVEERAYPHLWRLTEVIPNRRIVYDWRYEGFPGQSVVEWDLSQSAGGTTLRLTHSGVETFPQDDPAFLRESCQGGWEYFLRERLAAFLGQQKS